MQCPRCKKEIDDNSLKCKFCNSKVASVCKNCGAINPITSTECSNCHKVLLKICSSCGSANLPDAKACRKCGAEFEIQQVQKKFNPKPEYTAEMNSQQKVKAKLLDAIKDGCSTIITINGESGIGKNLVLRYTINELKNAKLIWL